MCIQLLQIAKPENGAKIPRLAAPFQIFLGPNQIWHKEKT